MTTFDRLMAEATPLIHAGLHRRDSPPVEGGRWPVGVILRPDRAPATRLEAAMVEAEVYAGPGHFRTGVSGSVHFTVRALEGYRDVVVEQDEAVRRYARALGCAVIATAELVRFRYEDGADGRLMRPEVLSSAPMGCR